MDLNTLQEKLSANVNVYLADGIYGPKTWKDVLIENIDSDIRNVQMGKDGKYFRESGGTYKVALSYWYKPLNVGKSNVAIGNKNFAIETLELYKTAIQAGLFDEQIRQIEAQKSKDRAKSILDKAAAN